MPTTSADAASIQATSPLSTLPSGLACPGLRGTNGHPQACDRACDTHDAVHSCRLLAKTMMQNTLPAVPHLTSLRASVSVRDRHASIFSQPPMGDLDADRRLASLVFTPIHQSDDPQDGLSVESHLDHFIHRPIIFDIGFQNRIEHRIRRQTVFVLLIGLAIRQSAHDPAFAWE